MPPVPLDVPFTTTTWLAAGGTADELRGLVRARVLRRVARGIYVPVSAPDTLASRLQVAALALPPAGVLARTGAAWVYGVDTTPPGPQRPRRLEVAVPRGVEPVCSPVVRCYVEDLVEEDVDVVDGVRVTSPMRTAVDLARWLPRGDALAAVDAFAHQQLVDLDALAASLQRWKGHAFVLQAREVIALGDGRSESWGESMTRLRLHDAGFDMPDLQVQLTIEGRQVRLDFGWRRERKALEYDGERWHSSAEQRRHDDERRRLLTRAGWEVAVVTKEHVLGRGRHFEEVVCRLTGQTPRRFAA